MPDTPFKAMGREPSRRFLRETEEPREVPSTRCEKCGGMVYESDWPWCKNGDPQTHRRD